MNQLQTVMSQFETIKEVITKLKANGLDPLDCLSWVYLLDLHSRYKAFNGIDLDVHYDMQNSIKAVLKRKAAMLDTEIEVQGKIPIGIDGTPVYWHSDMLKHLGVK